MIHKPSNPLTIVHVSTCILSLHIMQMLRDQYNVVRTILFISDIMIINYYFLFSVYFEL